MYQFIVPELVALRADNYRVRFIKAVLMSDEVEAAFCPRFVAY